MVLPIDQYYFGYFLRGQSLLVDGSNLIYWYELLRETLKHNSILYVIEENLGDGPGDFSTVEEDEAFSLRRDTYIYVQETMIVSLDYELRPLFQGLEPYDMITAIKAHFVSEIKYEQYKQLDKFLSFKMEEQTCLETHLEKMLDMFTNLTEVYDYWMADSFAILAVLRSLPPSYEQYICGYAMERDSITFLEFIEQIGTVKVELIDGEVIDDEKGIYLIYRIINVLSFQTLVEKYLILILFSKQEHMTSGRGSII